MSDVVDVEDLAGRFVACTLPKAEWTHAAHYNMNELPRRRVG